MPGLAHPIGNYDIKRRDRKRLTIYSGENAGLQSLDHKLLQRMLRKLLTKLNHAILVDLME